VDLEHSLRPAEKVEIPLMSRIIPPPFQRPLPEINEMNAYYWCGGADGDLHIQRCGGCGRYNHPYQAICNACSSRDVKPVAVSGRGTVLSLTVNHQPWYPAIPTPYVIALVELEEQSDIRLVTNLMNVPVEDARPGMAVKVYFEQHGEIFMPLFEPA
jgi:uncharacterized OB-fold protein